MALVKVIQGHRFRYQSKAHIRFLAIAFDWSKIALYTPFAFDPPPPDVRVQSSNWTSDLFSTYSYIFNVN